MSSYHSPYHHLGGSLSPEDPTYVVRNADRQLYESLCQGEFCYVLNSRQMGKSSLRVRVMQRLKAEGFACAVIDLSAMGTESTETAWYKGIAYRILRNFPATRSFNWRQWWEDHSFLSPVQQLGELISEIILVMVEENIIIFIDEIDSVLSLNFPTDDFFSWIRSCYNYRADNPDYQKLTFCLLGVATPSDLIQDKKRTPFNLGQGIELNGFELEQAQDSLGNGLIQASISNSDQVLRDILTWTGGQPFLTQKLCQLVVTYGKDLSVEEIVHTYILKNWQSQDEPEHLRTICDRIYSNPERTSRLLGLYQQVLLHNAIASDDSPEQQELRLTGLVVKKKDQLQVFNPIYRTIFAPEWVSQALSQLRPYALPLNQWNESRGKDKSKLLTGIALQNALAWARGKSLSDLDYQYLSAGQEAEKDQISEALQMEAQAKQVLEEANHKANRRIKMGFGILGLAGVILATSLIFSSKTIQLAHSEAIEAQNQAEQAQSNVKIAHIELKRSQDIATEERKKAKLAQAEVTQALKKIEEANQVTTQAQLEAKQAKLTAQTAQVEAQNFQSNAQKARLEAEMAIAQRQQAEAQAIQAQQTLTDAKKQITLAERELHLLTVGTRLEKSALALTRKFPHPKLDNLVTAIDLGKELQSLVSEKTPLIDYPAITPLLVLQNYLNQMPSRGVFPSSFPIDITLEPLDGIWFSADGKRYVTVHNYDGYRRLFWQLWNGNGNPVGEAMEINDSFFPMPESVYLKSNNANSQQKEVDLIAINCGNSETICIKDLPHNSRVEQVPGIKAAFNPEKKELITIDSQLMLRRWSLFEGDKWLGAKIAEIQFPFDPKRMLPHETLTEVYFTPSGQHLLMVNKNNDTIEVFDLEANLLKVLDQPKDLSVLDQRFPFFDISGNPLPTIELQNLVGQGSQKFSLSLNNPQGMGFFAKNNRIATIYQNPQSKTNIFQILSRDGRLIHEYRSKSKLRSMNILFQPHGEYVATVECLSLQKNECIARIWNDQGKQIREITFSDQTRIEWTPNGKYLALSDAKVLRLISPNNSRTRIYQTNGSVISFQPSQKNSPELYFWTRYGGSAKVWHSSKQSPITQVNPPGMNSMITEAWYDEQKQKITATAIHPELGNSIYQWNFAQVDEPPSTLLQAQRFHNAWLSPDGSSILLGQFNGDLELRSITGEYVTSFIGHQNAVDQVQFSPDGSQIMTYSQQEQIAMIWDKQGRQLAQYQSRQAPSMNRNWTEIMTLGSVPKLVASLPDAQVKIWSLDSLDTLLIKACRRIERYQEIHEGDRNLCDEN